MALAKSSGGAATLPDRRKLLAVVYVDMVGYSRLIGFDDVGTLQRLRTFRNNLIDPAIEEYGGRTVQTGGDSLLIVFDSIEGAVSCAVKVQRRVPIIDGDQPSDRTIRFRIGINIGDTIAVGTDLHGDTVNIVARLQAACPPGGLCVSRSVRDHVHGRLGLVFEQLGPLRLKNIAQPVDAFVVRLQAAEMARGASDAGPHADRPAAETTPTHSNNLPQLPHRLIGRARDVAEVEALLSRYRLVTLVGTAGVGKTSLALQVGTGLLAHFPDGVRFVELSPLDQAELVGETVAAVFGLPVQSERPATDAILAFLRSKRVLLVLDNCEHVIAAAASLADTLLKTCPGVFVLATSREVLSVAGEHVYPVPLLDVPPRSTALTAREAMQHSAVNLFVARAAAALGRFSLTDENAPIIAEICRRLDGIPLALELAAPRLRVLTPEALQARLNSQLHLLTGGGRRAVPRQQTLRAAIEWSYALLSEAEQTMLQRLGVFAGSFALEAVAAVAAGAPVEATDVFDTLAGLVDKSLVVSLTGGGENRYRLLEVTRAFVLEKSATGSHAELAHRLCEYLAIMFERADQTWRVTRRADWLAAYEPELDNLRVALGWSLRPNGNPALGVSLISHTDWMWRELALLQEQQRWFELAGTFVDAATPASAEARICLALGWSPCAGNRKRLSHNLRAIDLTRQVDSEPVLLGQALTQAALSTTRYRDAGEAERYIDEGLSVLRSCGRTKQLAIALLAAGAIRMDAGNLQAAQALIEEALALFRAFGDARLNDTCEAQLATVAFEAGQMAEAISRARQAAETSRRHGTLQAEFLALHWLAGLLILDDQIEPGRAAALRAFELSRALGDADLPGSIHQLALIIAVHGETDTAACLAGFAERYADQHQLSSFEITVAIRSRLVERLHGAMTREECQTAMAAGAAWSEQEAVAAARAA